MILTLGSLPQAADGDDQNDLPCSENVAYATIKNSPTMANMTCSKNIAYATIQQTTKDSMTSTISSSTVVYEELDRKSSEH